MYITFYQKTGEKPDGPPSGITTYLGARGLSSFLRACTYEGKSYLEIEIKKSSCTILNNFLQQYDFLEFNKFLLLKFFEKIKFLAPDPFTDIYLDFCFKNKEINKVFPVKDALIVENGNKNLEMLSSGSKKFYTFPEGMVKQLVNETNSTLDVFVYFAVLVLYENCVEAQLFSGAFSSFNNNLKNKSLPVVVEKFLQHTKKNPLVLTVCYNDFLNQMGFHVSTLSRSLLDKALGAIYNLSFAVRGSKGSTEIQERVVYRLIKYKKNKQQFADLYISPESFFVYYSSGILGLQNCISPIIQEIKKKFPKNVPLYTFPIFFYVMTQLKKQPVPGNDKLFLKNFRARNVICIKQIFEIVVSILIKQKYIVSIKHKKSGVLLKKP